MSNFESKVHDTENGVKLKAVRCVLIDLTIVALALVAVFHQYIFTDAVFWVGRLSDTVKQEFGVAKFTSEELAAGRLPLWNPYVYLGYPHMAMGYSGVFYPSTVIYAFGSFLTVFKYDFLSHLLLGAFVMYGLGRSLFETRCAAVCCALYFAFVTGYVRTAWTGVVAIAHFETYVPLALLCLVNTLRGRSPIWAVAWGLVLCLQIFAGYFQLLTYELIVFGIFCAFELARQFVDRREQKRVVVNRAFWLLAGTTLGILGASVQLIPAFELLSSESVRGNGVSKSFLMFGSTDLLDDIRDCFAWKDISGTVRRGGLPTAFLVAFGLVGVVQWRTKIAYAILVGGVAAFIVSAGYDTPVYDTITQLPLLGTMRMSRRMLFFATFMLICLAGFGIDALLRGPQSGRRLQPNLIVFFVALVFLGVWPLFQGVQLTNPYFVLYSFVALMLFVYLLGPNPSKSMVVIAFLAAISFDCSRFLNHATRDPASEDEARISEDWISIADQHKAYDRFVIFPKEKERFTTLNAQIGSLYRERTLNGGGALGLGRYVDYFERSLDVQRVIWTEDGEYGGLWGWGPMWLTSSPQVDALGSVNVKYFVVPQPGAPLLDALTQMSENIKRFDMTDLVVYQNSAAAPPAYLLHKSVVDAERAGYFSRSDVEVRMIQRQDPLTGSIAYEAISSSTDDERRDGGDAPSYDYDEAVLESPVQLKLGNPTAPESAEITNYLPRRITIATHVEAPGILVLSDIYYPGWKCRVNGRRDETVFPVNCVVRGVQVYPGDTEVVFTYDPASFRIGLVLSLVAACLAIVAVSAIAVMRYRSRTQVSVGG